MLSGFAPNIYFLYFSYGIVVGKKLDYYNFSKCQELIINLPMLGFYSVNIRNENAQQQLLPTATSPKVVASVKCPPVNQNI